jgi:hypothetical protein
VSLNARFWRAIGIVWIIFWITENAAFSRLHLWIALVFLLLWDPRADVRSTKE